MPVLMGIIGQKNKSVEGQKLTSFANTVFDAVTFENEQAFVCGGYRSEQRNHSDSIRILPERHGLTIGKLFDRQTSQPGTPNNLEVQALIENPKLLFKNWWGRYITVLYNKQQQKHTLIRDPQGLSTLFYIVRPGSVLFSTDMGLLYDMLEEKPSLNLDYFAEYISNKNHTSDAIPFTVVKQLLPGMALHINADGSVAHEQLWSLEPFKCSFITDTKQFEEELLATLRSCVKAWANGSNNISVELSGGADSTAVMILLRDVCPDANIVAINYFDSKTPSSNEIEYAQEVADMCDAPLQLIDWQTVGLTDPLPTQWRPDKPSTMFLFPKMTEQLHAIATQHGSTEFMNGQGGDHVFLAPQPTEALADYWLQRGFRGITQPVKELSAASRTPWTLLAQHALSDITHYYGKKRKIVHEPTPFLHSDFSAQLKKQSLYLGDGMKNFYPGKINHIESIHHAVSYAERNRTMAHKITAHPLLSQPLIELALTVPTYQSFADGFDRILFRNAVSRIKKPKALWRTIKGQTTGSMTKMFFKDANFIHDLIENGTLMKSGMLNKQWLEREMIKIRHGQIENLWAITHLFTAQQWLNQWKL